MLYINKMSLMKCEKLDIIPIREMIKKRKELDEKRKEYMEMIEKGKEYKELVEKHKEWAEKIKEWVEQRKELNEKIKEYYNNSPCNSPCDLLLYSIFQKN